jgi:hypothetical protein
MGDLRSVEMLKQMRWREAHQANGAERDTATDRLIRLHGAITAIEATILEGAPRACPISTSTARD